MCIFMQELDTYYDLTYYHTNTFNSIVLTFNHISFKDAYGYREVEDNVMKQIFERLLN